MIGRIALGALAGAAVGALPGSSRLVTVLAATLGGAAIGAGLPRKPAGFSPWSLALLAFFAPVFTLTVAPGADMAMHVALARGLLQGELSPAWPGVHVGLYPRGFSALVALLAPLGLARAGLVAAGASYLVFWAGLAAMLEGPLKAPAARTVAAVAMLLSRTPQIFFDWGGNPTAMALGLALFGASQIETPRSGAVAALFFAAAAATHPLGACAGALALAFVAVRRRAWASAALAGAGLCAVLGGLALYGPRLSSREVQWIGDYATGPEAVHLRSTFAVLGDPAAVVTALAAAWLLWKRQWRAVAWSAGAIAGLGLLFQVLPAAGFYPVRFAPLLLLAVTPLWARAAAARIPMLAPLALAVALTFHFRWYQRAEPIATERDIAAIACADRTVPRTAVIDGAYGDATQWIPALIGRAITRPHEHASLFDETEAALAALPKPSWRFVGERLRYPPPLPPPSGAALCDGALYRIQ